MAFCRRIGPATRTALALALFVIPSSRHPVIPSSHACSLCANLQQVPTFRQEAAQPQARMILYGTFKNGQVSGTEPLDVQ